jgi:hypothetical protein
MDKGSGLDRLPEKTKRQQFRGWQNHSRRGDFLDIFFVKSPLIPLFQRERLESRTFHPRLQNGVFKFISS